ncbi:MAG: IPT/TIG domain-containing protein [Myxococcota bacterium]
MLALGATALVACVELPSAPEDGAGPEEPALPKAPAEPSFPEKPEEPSAEGLSLASVEPATGPVAGGTEVMLQGSGFLGGMTVLVDQSPALDQVRINETTVIFTTPPHPAGAVEVSAFHPDANGGEPVVLEDAFTYESDLSIDAVEPSEVDVGGGVPLTVHGAGFGADARFFVGGRAAIDQARVDDGSLVGIAPPGEYGPADVHVVSSGATATARDAITYRAAPRVDSLSPASGPPAGGPLVRLEGRGLEVDALVRFGEAEALPVDAASDDTWVDVQAPAGPPGGVVDVEVATDQGVDRLPRAWAWSDPEADPYVLSCSHLVPAAGPAAGGTETTLACDGLHYGVEVHFGETQAEVLSTDADTRTLVVRAPAGEPGAADVRVTSPYEEVVLEDAWTWEAASALSVTNVSPASGPPSGGTGVTIEGQGLDDQTSVRIGALPAGDVTLQADGTLEATTPPGGPGAADVRVLRAGEEAVLPGAFTYTTGDLDLSLVAPATAAQAGGTWLRVVGDGFDDGTEVVIGGETARVIERVSAAELHVRSPRLPVGTWDARVVRGGEEAVLEGALTTFDPRSAYGGTWGGPIDGAVNVTVRGTYGIGPIPGAFVVVRTADGEQLEGYTDDNGQVTLSEPWLDGVVEVTAGAEGFSTYSVVEYDARNVTVFLRPNTPPPPSDGGGDGEPSEPPPPSVLRGEVVGLGKYVVPPPGTCDQATVPGAEHCVECTPEAGCGDGFTCVDLLEQGHRCLATCEAPTDCPQGYACAASPAGTRCIPEPGEREARCSLSATSVFSQAMTVPATGVVGPGEEFEIETSRFGEVAIVCFAGYRDASGTFTPTALGVRRHVLSQPGLTQEDLDVVLDHPLDRTFRLRLQDPPTWSDGVRAPSVTVSLDLGPDGVIPFTRPLLEGSDDATWRLPRQLSGLSGNLYDASYSFYTSISADTPTGVPTAYNLVRNVTHVGEDRSPVWRDGAWALEPSQNDLDLHGVWGSASDRVLAVGARGRILLYDGVSWTAQSSGTSETLRALDGAAADDVWAVGDAGTVLHWDGLSWQPVEASEDDLRAVATAPGQPVWTAGALRVRRLDDTGWSLAGPPSLQDVHGLDAVEDGRVVAVGSGGRVFLRGVDGAWSPVPSPVDATLLDVDLDPVSGEIVAVGADGAVIQGTAEDGLAAVEVEGVQDTLTAVDRAPDGTLFAVGDNGRSLRRVDGAWQDSPIPDYRSRAEGVFAPGDGGPVRVVGGAAFILGPFLHYPAIEGATPDSETGGLTLGWNWDGGPAGQYTQLTLFEEFGPDIWTLVVDGDRREALLPDLEALANLAGVGSGSRRIEVLRVLNVDFDIDEYTTRDFSIFRRSSWTVNRGSFFAP